jgi:hypothetical protein
MKKSFVLLAIMFLFKGSPLLAQHPVIAIQNGDAPGFFHNLDEAIIEAEKGDTIYLPAGVFTCTVEEIEKTLHFVGSGHYPREMPHAGQTIINNNIVLAEGADSSSLQGIYMNGSLLVYKKDNKKLPYQNLKVTRCNIEDIYIGGYFSSTSYTENDISDVLISETVIRGELYGFNPENCIVQKCIIGGQVTSFSGSEFSNNIFLSTADNPLVTGISQVTFKNNIFLKDESVLYYTSDCEYYNNLFVDDLESNTGSGNNIAPSNITNVPLDDIFVNYTNNGFDYEDDFQLQEGSAGIGAGEDGTDIGLYGTSQPYTNGVTSYPYVHAISVPATTDADGMLNIQVKVSAQDY